MGKADIVTKAYMRKSNIFADAFNYLIYDGKKVVDPEKLTEVDSTEIAIPFGATASRRGNRPCRGRAALLPAGRRAGLTGWLPIEADRQKICFSWTMLLVA